MKRILTLNQKRTVACLLTVVYIGLLILLFVYVGKPFISMLNDKGMFKEWVASHGIWGYIIFVLMTILQVFAAIIPGEPFEIAAGYAFGWFGGTILALIGIALGQTIVFFIIRKFGRRALDLFIPQSKIESIKFFSDTGNMFRMMFILFFIPGTPKDILTYCAGLSKIDYVSFILITMIARIPSIVSSTVSGDALSSGNYVFAAVIIAVSAIISVGGMIIYSKIKKSIEREKIAREQK